MTTVSPSRRSAGILLHRRREDQLQVLLVHPGGPLWSRKDDGAWSVPKGEHPEAEQPQAAALRELHEETGLDLPDAALLDLGEIKQKSGKRVRAWAAEADFDVEHADGDVVCLTYPRGRDGRA